MPLPVELAARLSKRGILTAQSVVQENVPLEEVIAEDYDDKKGTSGGKNKTKNESMVVEYSEEDIRYKKSGFPGCPNKYNIYHECSNYCRETFGNGKLTPDPKYDFLRKKMLAKYPLPEGWYEIYDPGTGRFYYWEYKTGTVGWLPPSHPKHVPSEPAAALREEIKMTETEDESDSGDEEVFTEKNKSKHQVEKHRSKGRPKVKENDLDPMDPAAYSDIPRGKWSAGLAVSSHITFILILTISYIQILFCSLKQKLVLTQL